MQNTDNKSANMSMRSIHICTLDNFLVTTSIETRNFRKFFSYA